MIAWHRPTSKFNVIFFVVDEVFFPVNKVLMVFITLCQKCCEPSCILTIWHYAQLPEGRKPQRLGGVKVSFPLKKALSSLPSPLLCSGGYNVWGKMRQVNEDDVVLTSHSYAGFIFGHALNFRQKGQRCPQPL